MTFPNAWDLAEEDSPQVNVDSSAMGGTIGGAIELTEKQKEILDIISQNNQIPYRKLAVKLKINESAVLKYLNALKKKGVLTRLGVTRGYWEVMLIVEHKK